MILKMNCSLKPLSWHYVEGVEDLHYDVIPKNEKLDNEVFLWTEHKKKADRVININDNDYDYHSITVDRINRTGVESKEWFITDGPVYLLNDDGNTIERIR